MSSRCTKINIV